MSKLQPKSGKRTKSAATVEPFAFQGCWLLCLGVEDVINVRDALSNAASGDPPWGAEPYLGQHSEQRNMEQVKFHETRPIR
jgi:hypothetical protein